MADIKFMDISENDNPATTDSILVGNQENGVKRTTLGKIGDMFAVHGLFHTEVVTVPLVNDKSYYDINAPAVEGYTFAFWLSPSVAGRSIANYIDNANNAGAKIYINITPGQDLQTGDQYNPTPHVQAIAVYVKNTVA